MEILDAGRSDRSRTGQPLHRVRRIKASSPMVLRGELSPTTANHDFKQQEERIRPEAVIVSTSALNPRRERRGRRTIRSQGACECHCDTAPQEPIGHEQGAPAGCWALRGTDGGQSVKGGDLA